MRHRCASPPKVRPHRGNDLPFERIGRSGVRSQSGRRCYRHWWCWCGVLRRYVRRAVGGRIKSCAPELRRLLESTMDRQRAQDHDVQRCTRVQCGDLLGFPAREGPQDPSGLDWISRWWRRRSPHNRSIAIVVSVGSAAAGPTSRPAWTRGQDGARSLPFRARRRRR